MKLEVDKPEVTDLVVVYSGRFQPFHAGHYVSYLKLAKKFGKENVYIATSNSTSGAKSPFDFNEKKEIATKMFNVPSDKFIQVSNPYAPKEILQGFDGKTTAYIAAVGEKDESRLSGKYFKPYKGKTGYGYDEIGYTYAVPAESSPISGTDVRNWLGSGDDESKKKGFLKAYPKFNADIFKMITNKLNEEGFPGGIGTGLNLPGGYINGAPTGSANESNNTEPSSALRPEPKPTRHQIEHPSDEPDWHKNETLYDPIGHIMDRVLSEEMFKEFVDSYFTEAPNPIMDKEFDYTASDGTKKKITVKGALRLAKDHPAHVQATKMVGSDKPNAMAKGPTDAPANEPKKLPQPGKAATQAAKPSQPGQPVKQGQTQQGKADKANPTSPTPQGVEQTPPAQTLSGAELKSSAEKTPEEKSQEKKAEKYGSFKEFFKSESESIKKQAQALWNDFSTEEHHAADEMNNPESETRKGFVDRAAKFMTEFPENMVKGAYEVAKHKYHQLKNTTKAAKSIAISLSHGKGFQFGYEKDKNGKWGVNKKEAEKQKSAAKATAWDAAKIAGAVVTGGAISGAIGHIVGGGAVSGIGSAAISGLGDTVSHGVGSFAHHMAVDFGKHCGFEAMGLGAGIDLEQAQKLAAKAGLTSVGVLPHMDKLFSNAMSYLSEDATKEDETKQHSDLLMNLVATILEKMKDFKPSSQQMFETMQSYSENKKKVGEIEQGKEITNLLKPIQEQISPLKRENIYHFVEYASKRLNLKEQPKVTLVEDPEFSRQNHSLGGYNVDSKEIFVATEGRLTADILRTIAHEMVHRKQDEMGLIGDSVKDGETGSTVENKANSIAAILLREYGKLNKTIYNEDISMDVDKGDTVLMGKFKNKRTTVKDIGTDDYGMPTINGKKAATFRIPRGEKAKPNPQSVFDEVTTNDWHFKAIMKLYDKASSFGKKKIGAVICKDPNASRRDIEVQLRDTDYNEITDITDKLRLSEYIEKKKLSEKLTQSNLDSVEKYADRELDPADTVVCDNCSWTWKIADGGTDVYTCHKCGHDNQPKLNESIKWEEDTYKKCMLGKLPLSLNIIQKLVEPIKATTLHITDVNNLSKVAALEGTKKSISTFNKTTKWGKIVQGKGLWTEGGVLVALSGTILAQSIMDLWTEPDKQGRRWVNPGTVIANLGREQDVVFNFAPELLPYKWQYMEHGFDGTITNADKAEFIKKYYEAAERYMLSKKKDFQEKYSNLNGLHWEADWNEVVLTNIKIEKILVIQNKTLLQDYPWDIQKKHREIELSKSRADANKWLESQKNPNDRQKEIDKIKQKYKNVEVAKNEADVENFINNNGGQVMNESVNKSVISEGGAYGHMSHPFDDMNLTFGDLKNIITGALTGKLELTREKTDGQALAISWKNGRLIAARNKGNLANAGANAMGIEDVASKFAGRGGLTDAYNFAMRDLSAAISSLSEPQRNKIFDEGKCFMNLEVIWPTSVNVIPYGQPLLVFHNTNCYDETGKAVGANQGAATMLAGMIKQVNGDVQSKYTIQGPPVTRLPNNEELGSKQTKYLTQLQKLQFQFQLSNRDGVAEYHQAWWADFIDKSKVKLQKLEKDALINRWAFGDKSFRLNTITDKDAQKWAIDNDKVNVAKQQKENIRPFEEIFLGVGADVLSFMDSVLTANPNAAIASMKQRLRDIADKVRGSGDITKIQKLKQELARLQSIGGLDKIVPNEGIVFIYKGNTYKLTGTFAPLNQILGIFYE